MIRFDPKNGELGKAMGVFAKQYGKELEDPAVRQGQSEDHAPLGPWVGGSVLERARSTAG